MLGLNALAKRIFGSHNDRVLRQLRAQVDKVNGFERQFEAMSDDELAARTVAFRERLAAGEPLDRLLPEAFATVREAAKRTLGQRHYDVQLIGGMVLHRGEIAEMKTGEGKTLVATLAVYLNALPGKGVHVVTVNDYLARRDAEWMGQIYRFLGMSVGVIVPGMSDWDRRAAYQSDITYATNNELGFDYLRDNMKYSRDQMVQRPFHFAIVDEVDSILIDEARTPLIISGPTEDRSELYHKVDSVVKRLSPEHYEKDEKQKTVVLTEAGTEWVENELAALGILQGANLYDIENTQAVHTLNQSLRANIMFRRDTDYIVRDGKVVIIDEFTGRMMEGRRWSEGLHQAVEAKEGVEVQPENQTLASITFQNLFRLYPKLAGMTGTAATEAAEFHDIYKLGVVEIPTNLPVRRRDEDDEFYKDAKDKYAAITRTIREARERGQPVLVGTVSIEKSELLSDYLKREGVPHNVLNARFHEQEAHIVAQAGRWGAVTIATNMAGRGTDIQLGGNYEFRVADELGHMPDGPEKEAAKARIREEIALEKARVLEAGGLFVLGTERHESRRIVNQLRGRSGRQGDPGLSRFYLSLEDDLLRIFGAQSLLHRLMNSELKEGEAIVHPWISKAIETAQKKVEARNYEIRKQVVQYDDVMDDQRKVVYEQRNLVIDSENVSDIIEEFRRETVARLVAAHAPEGSYPEQWQVAELAEAARDTLGVDADIVAWAQEEGIEPSIVEDRLLAAAEAHIAAKRDASGPETWQQVEKAFLLQALDHHWKEHLATLDALRAVIHLRAYAQKTPLNEYKHEAFALFERMLSAVKAEVTGNLARAELRQAPPPMEELPLPPMTNFHLDPFTGENDAFGSGPLPGLVRAAGPAAAYPPGVDLADPSTWEGRVGRNQPCPCGSGKKYKHCHGALTGLTDKAA